MVPNDPISRAFRCPSRLSILRHLSTRRLPSENGPPGASWRVEKAPRFVLPFVVPKGAVFGCFWLALVGELQSEGSRPGGRFAS